MSVRRKHPASACARLSPIANELCALMRLLSHPNRVKIACALVDGEKSVGELEKDTDVTQPVLSRELARFRRSGVVRTRRQSRNIFYKLNDARVVKLLKAVSTALNC